MPKFHVYAHGTFWGEFEADTPEAAIQTAADAHGTEDVGDARASTEGMTADAITDAP